MSMAGAEAGRVLLNQSDDGGDRTDRANIDALISDDRVKARLRRSTSQLVRRHRLAVENVADTWSPLLLCRANISTNGGRLVTRTTDKAGTIVESPKPEIR
jgi:hypothetical protein